MHILQKTVLIGILGTLTGALYPHKHHSAGTQFLGSFLGSAFGTMVGSAIASSRSHRHVETDGETELCPCKACRHERYVQEKRARARRLKAQRSHIIPAPVMMVPAPFSTPYFVGFGPNVLVPPVFGFGLNVTL